MQSHWVCVLNFPVGLNTGGGGCHATNLTTLVPRSSQAKTEVWAKAGGKGMIYKAPRQSSVLARAKFVQCLLCRMFTFVLHLAADAASDPFPNYLKTRQKRWV